MEIMRFHYTGENYRKIQHISREGNPENAGNCGEFADINSTTTTCSIFFRNFNIGASCSEVEGKRKWTCTCITVASPASSSLAWMKGRTKAISKRRAKASVMKTSTAATPFCWHHVGFFSCHLHPVEELSYDREGAEITSRFVIFLSASIHLV